MHLQNHSQVHLLPVSAENTINFVAQEQLMSCALASWWCKPGSLLR